MKDPGIPRTPGGLGRAADIVSHARTKTDRNQIFALRKLLEILGFRSRNPSRPRG